MFSSSSCVCALNHQARCIREQRAFTERHRFVVGTCSAREKNEVSVLEFNEDSNTLDVTSIYSHPNEVWALETSPTDPSLLITSENGIYQREGNNSSSVNLYKMSNQTEDSIRDGKEQREAAYAGDQLDLEILAPLPLWNVTSFVHDIKWNSNNSIITSDSQYVSIYSVDNESINMTGKVKICNEEFNHSMHNINSNSGVVFKDSSHITSGGAGLSWDPHHADMCAVAANKCELKLIDTREGRATMAVKNIHKGCIRDIDYNPNKPDIVVTSGDDGRVKFWDLRHASRPIKTVRAHTHWACCARYNPFHDQIILSGGSDYIVNLWRIASISSAPFDTASLTTGDMNTSVIEDDIEVASNMSEDAASDSVDARVSMIDQHEDSVYGIAWSAAEAWMYCSLSYDGRVILSHVPSSEKYKILL